MSDETFHCAFSIDNSYCQHFAASMVSLIENNSEDSFCCHVLASNVSIENKNIIQKVALRHPNLKLIFYDFDGASYGHYRIDEHISFASYMRLFLGSTLPSHINRIVYIDSDTIIMGSIRDLFLMELGEEVIAAVPDAWSDDDKRDRLQLPPAHLYFNAGVLVINLDRWRAESWESKLINYVEANHTTLRYHDQDALNACMSGRVKYLDFKWNYQAWFSKAQLFPFGYNKKTFYRLKNFDRVIIHYSLRFKPWSVVSNVPLERQYLYYARKTPWRKTAQPDRTFRALVKRHVRELRGHFIRH